MKKFLLISLSLFLCAIGTSVRADVVQRLVRLSCRPADNKAVAIVYLTYDETTHLTPAIFRPDYDEDVALAGKSSRPVEQHPSAPLPIVIEPPPQPPRITPIPGRVVTLLGPPFECRFANGHVVRFGAYNLEAQASGMCGGDPGTLLNVWFDEKQIITDFNIGSCPADVYLRNITIDSTGIEICTFTDRANLTEFPTGFSSDFDSPFVCKKILSS